MCGLKDRTLWFWIHPNIHFKTFYTVQCVHTEIQTVSDVKILYLIKMSQIIETVLTTSKADKRTMITNSITTKYTTYKGYPSHIDVETK